MNARAELLLYVLCVCVRLLTRGQAMRLLGITDEANFKRLVRDLVAHDLVSEITVWAKAVPEIREPLLRSEIDPAGHATEEDALLQRFGQVLRLAHARWAGFSAAPVTCYVARRHAGHVYGVHRAGTLAKPLQATHDLAVAEVYLTIRKLNCNLDHTENWRGEDSCISFKLGDKTPDAAIMTCAELTPETVIEIVGGDYTYDRLLTISRECNRRGLSYEFW